MRTRIRSIAAVAGTSVLLLLTAGTASAEEHSTDSIVPDTDDILGSISDFVSELLRRVLG